MNRIKRIREVIKEASKIYKENPFINKFEAFKNAYAIVKSKEEQSYENNGHIVKELVESYKSNDWTY